MKRLLQRGRVVSASATPESGGYPRRVSQVAQKLFREAPVRARVDWGAGGRRALNGKKNAAAASAAARGWVVAPQYQTFFFTCRESFRSTTLRARRAGAPRATAPAPFDTNRKAANRGRAGGRLHHPRAPAGGLLLGGASDGGCGGGRAVFFSVSFFLPAKVRSRRRQG